MLLVNPTPSERLLKEVRAELVLRDSSLSQLALAVGVKRQNLTKALVGDWQGPKAKLVIETSLREMKAMPQDD